MDPLPTQLPLVMKAAFQTCVSISAFPNNKEVLERVLGAAREAGNEMAQWILKVNGRVVPRRSFRPLRDDEIHSPVEIKKREVFD